MTNEVCFYLPLRDWNTLPDDASRKNAVTALEEGKVVLLPELSFTLNPQEQKFLKPDSVKAGTKSIKFSLAQQRVWGMAQKEDSFLLAGMMRRYAESARNLVTRLFPGYTDMVTGNTSFRPVEAEGRIQSKRHDDRLLHVDAFPSRPTHGTRLLRVFTNVNPEGGVRIWRVGQPFASVAANFLPQIPSYNKCVASLLKLTKITKTLRSPYDHYMLHLHDRMKLDDAYQAQVENTTVQFPAGSSWIVFSDQVSHAAMSGQHAFEQTFTLSPHVQNNPDTSPLRVLEKLSGKKLA
jgi:hypothetical protein